MTELGFSERDFIGKTMPERLKLVVARLATNKRKATGIELLPAEYLGFEQMAGYDQAIVACPEGLALHCLGYDTPLVLTPGPDIGVAVIHSRPWVELEPVEKNRIQLGYRG